METRCNCLGHLRERVRLAGAVAGPRLPGDSRFRAFDLAYQSAHSKDSGYSSAFLKALGHDCSGLVNPAIERSYDFESDLDHSRLSDEYRRATVEEALRAVRAKKRGYMRTGARCTARKSAGRHTRSRMEGRRSESRANRGESGNHGAVPST